MATRKRSGNKQPANDPALKSATKEAAQEAEQDARTGDVETVSQSSGGPATDLPTGQRRSHPPA